MAIIRACTTIEQSKKLAEILPLDSADIDYIPVVTTDGIDGEYSVIVNKWDNDHIIEEGWIPCWSLAALMHLLPSKFTKKGKYSETTYNIDIRKYALTEDTDIYQIAYGNYKFYEDGNSSWKDIINTSEKENLIDVAFEMICWLKENNIL